MASPIGEEKFDLPSPKRQKMMEAQTCDDSESDDSSFDLDDRHEGTTKEIKEFNDECSKSKGYEIDFSKFRYWGNWQPVDLENGSWSEHDESDGDLMHTLANLALTERNAKNGTSLEVAKILRANFHPSTGVTFYISFEVNDPSESDGNQTIPYRARVRYMGFHDIEVSYCEPK